MSKNPKPTAEELRCIYNLILRGYDDADILAEYASLYENGNLMFPYRTDKRFFRERRKELAAAEEVLRRRIEKKADPVISKRREEHYNHLADIAQLLLVSDIDDRDMLVYVALRDTGTFDGMAPDHLGSMLKRNAVNASIQCGEWDFDCFLLHLEAESSELAGFGYHDFAGVYPYELIETLGVLAKRKVFKGTCPICEDC